MWIMTENGWRALVVRNCVPAPRDLSLLEMLGKSPERETALRADKSRSIL
jgi:hypothetical protein